MKIAIDHRLPFLFAHGGLQLQIEYTKDALRAIGIDAEYVRWWDTGQQADLIHHFGVPGLQYVEYAKKKKIPLVETPILTETCNRSDAALRRQGMMVRALLAVPIGRGIKSQLYWQVFTEDVYHVVGLEAERQVLTSVYGTEQDRIFTVPLGTPEAFLQGARSGAAEDHLITTGTIVGRKNPVILARLARETGVPILFVGDPYAKDAYWKEFESLIDDRIVKYQPHVADPVALAALYRKARGFVMLSEYENWCLSAHEAAGCGLPLLLPDQKWSRERFGDGAHFFPPGPAAQDFAGKAAALRAFYDASGKMQAPKVELPTWSDVARKLKTVYERVLGK